MNYQKLGKTGVDISVIALGTWALGGGVGWGDQHDDNESIKIIHAALDNGINIMDTAPAYGFGHSEEVVGKAIKDRRDKAIVATKCGLWWGDERGSFFFEQEGNKVNRTLRPDTIRDELEISLKRLQTDYIDIYFTHWPAIEPELTPIEETMACLLDLKKEGKIRMIGVSNVGIEEMSEYVKAGQLDANQPRYNLLTRDIEKEIVPFCHENNVGIISYMALEHGILTGTVTMDTQYGNGDWRSDGGWNPWFRPINRKKVIDMLDSWKDITDKHNCTMAQLAIAWTFHQKATTSVLCGAQKVSEIVENAAAGQIKLDEEDLSRMRKDAEAIGEPEEEPEAAKYE
jgi:methylglyoxal reductase